MIQEDPTGEVDQYGKPKSKTSTPYTPNDYVGGTARQWAAWGVTDGVNQGADVADKPGYAWYHTGSLGGSQGFGGADWIQGKRSVFDNYQPGGGSTPPPGGGGSPAPTAPPSGTNQASINQQAQNASTYSATPNAAPTQQTTNQGTQDVVRNSYLQQATQGTQVDRNDPNFRQQADTYAAGVERARRNYMADQAEGAGPYATGAMRGQARMSAERAGQATGQFEAELVERELLQRRNEIQNALQNLGGMINSDQTRALQQQLADLNAAIQRQGIESSANVALSGQSLQRQLAELQNLYNYAALNQADRQFGASLGENARQYNNTLGFNIGDREAYWNNEIIRNAFPR